MCLQQGKFRINKMAGEIQISAIDGITVAVQMYDASGAAFGSPISATEVGTTGQYLASVPANTPYGHYLLVATAVGGDNPVIGSGEIFWDGAYELDVALATVQGLDPNNPATTTQTNLDAGNVHIDITGDQVTTTTFTRV